jgi:hypothetical protein
MKRLALLSVALLLLTPFAFAQFKYTTVECPGMHVVAVLVLCPVNKW